MVALNYYKHDAIWLRKVFKSFSFRLFYFFLSLNSLIKKIFLFCSVGCSNDHDRERNEIMTKSSCGAPKEVFVPLVPQATYEQVNILI